MSYGFGPRGAKAATTRPAPKGDPYGTQTWFKDASAAGSNDGTILDAEWLNAFIGERLYLAVQSNVPPPPGVADDSWQTRAILALIQQQVAVQTGGLSNLATTLPALVQTEVNNRISADSTFLTSASVVDNLTTQQATVPLSANQGYILNTLLLSLSTNLAAEIVARGAADSAEATTRANDIAAEATLRAADVAAEATARSNADTTEAAARAAAVTAEATARANAVTAEATARAAADIASAAFSTTSGVSSVMTLTTGGGTTITATLPTFNVGAVI